MKITAFEVRNDEKDTLEATAASHNVELTVVNKPLDDSTISYAEGADGVTILGKSFISRDILKKLKTMGVKIISTRTIGRDHIDLAAAQEMEIAIFNSSYAPDGVAEFTVMLMLMSLRNYKASLYRINVNDYSLMGLMGRELRTLTVGVIGAGAIGRKVIQILSGFRCKVLAYDPYASDSSTLEGDATFVSLDELYAKSDIITLHLPLTKETWHMIDSTTINKMKDGVVLINCARGSLMNIEALIEGIENKKIGALGMDVIEEEEEIYHQDLRTDILSNRNMAYIRQFPNVILTPHMAFYTDEAVKSMAVHGIENIVKFFK